jgi:hypothetical protein
MTALARAVATLVVALVLAMAATAYWLDRRGVKRTKLAAAAIELKLERTRTSVLQLSNEIAAVHSGIAELRNEIAGLRATTGGAMQPTSIELGPADTYDKLDHNWKSYADTSERTVVPCTDGGPSRPLVIVTLGQSNAANHGQGLYVPKHRVDNFNLYDGKCYKAVEPLLGPSGQGGNFATRLGDMLIERRLADRVVLAPIAMGGTSVEQWAHEGVFNRRITASIRRLYDAGLTPDYILWHQGEGNAGASDVGGRQYRKNLLEVVASFRAYSVNAPFFVALVTRCGEGPKPNAVNVREGQRTAVVGQLGIFVGPDTDLIGSEHRFDACHMSESGLALHASAWADILEGFARAKAAR